MSQAAPDVPAQPDPEQLPRGLTPHAPLRRITVLVNPMSGGVGPGAAEEARDLMAGFACDFEIVELEAARIDGAIDEALASKPDLLVVLAGDGTAGAAASRAGPDGPLVAPLPGGTMNMLPRALYGSRDWRAALVTALSEGVPHTVAGGEVEGHPFFCAAILGSPALWAPAREALREGQMRHAWLYARRAFRRAFSGRIRFNLDSGELRRAEALVLISPMISKAMEEPVGLEAAIMNPSDAAEAFRLAARAVFDDWRHDPSVRTQPAREVAVRSRSRIPAIVDGEPILLGPSARVRFNPRAFRALAPIPEAAADSV